MTNRNREDNCMDTSMSEKKELTLELIRDRIIAPIFRRCCPKLWMKISQQRRHHYCNEYIVEEEVHTVISNMINSEKPVMLGRLGNTERHIIAEYLMKKNGVLKRYSPKWKNWLLSTSGFFVLDNEEDEIDELAELILSSMSECDLEGIWDFEFERFLITRYAKNAKITHVNNTLIYTNTMQSWGMSLKGKRVLVISPFEETIRIQYDRREMIWSGKKILPDFTLMTLKAPYTAGGNIPQNKYWMNIYEDLCRRIDKIDFDVAIIGCGVYGYPLSAYIKQSGRKALEMCGETQIIFGIIGKRWEDGGYVDKYKNEYWIHPIDDKPINYQSIEGGCYW